MVATTPDWRLYASQQSAEPIKADDLPETTRITTPLGTAPTDETPWDSTQFEVETDELGDAEATDQDEIVDAADSFWSKVSALIGSPHPGAGETADDSFLVSSLSPDFLAVTESQTTQRSKLVPPWPRLRTS